MKNKLAQIPLVSPVGFIILFLLIVLSFYAGSYFERKSNQKQLKTQSAQISLTPSLQNQKLIVIGVTDGDTLKLSTGKTFRLYGVNAPEYKEPYYKEAIAFTKNLVLNKEISYEQEEKYKEDRFGRILGYVFVEGKHLNLELVRNGLAKVVLYEKRAKLKYQDELLIAEKEAKEKKLGVWSQ